MEKSEQNQFERGNKTGVVGQGAPSYYEDIAPTRLIK